MTTPLAQVTDVVVRYGRHTAVHASSFVLPHPGVTALIGPNGSGKSTVLHTLAGLIRPTEGTVTVLGADPAENRRAISLVPQSIAVPAGMPITVTETVAMGRYPSVGLLRRMRQADRQRTRTAMEQLGIADLGRRHLTELSGGQRQRVHVAQAIAQDHLALFLDEPLTGLDLVSARAIDRIIHSERERGHSVVLTTHDLAEAHAADHVVLMNRRVIASGPPQLVLTRQNLETAYGLGTLHAMPDNRPGGLLDNPTPSGWDSRGYDEM